MRRNCGTLPEINVTCRRRPRAAAVLQENAMNPLRRQLLRLLAAAAALPAVSRFAWAQTYPSRPIRLAVPFAPGGATDVVGRLWADRIKPLIGTAIVENRASGGATAAARAVADGYTFLFGNTSTQVLVPAAMARPPYDPLRDFVGIYILCLSPNSIVVHESVPARTLGELIAYAKTNPGKLSYGSAGAGTMTNLTGELFKQLIGAPDIVHIPYKGSAPGIADLASGHILMMTPNLGGTLIDLHRAGRVRILAVTARTRLKIAPDIPTALEAGLPGMVAENFNGLFAPARLPKPLVERFARATRTMVADAEFQKPLIESGFEPILDSGPEAAQRLVGEELARWAPVMKATAFRL
jgi:tripartite-type tricarboxylate transporter receptor subunit TctC